MTLTETTTVKVAQAKGRPMLSWVGKRPLREVRAYPAQLVERFRLDGEASGSVDWSEWPDRVERGGLLFHGDNKEVLAYLLAHGFRGKVDLVYIDPPFDSGADYVRRVQLRGASGTARLDGEDYTLGEQIQYTDIWANDNYLQFMYERLLLIKELLSPTGSVYLHCDVNKSHLLRSLLDEVFGSDALLNEIVWKRTAGRSDSTTFNHIHDTLFLYGKGETRTFNKQFTPHSQQYLDRYFSFVADDGRRFATIDATQAGLRKGPSGSAWRGFDPSSKGNHWKFAPVELDRLDAEGRIYWPIKESGWPRLKSYLDEVRGAAIQSIWTDVTVINSQADERADFPTQKPEVLLERILRASSNPGDIVLDCFIGSGTTAAVAQKLGRRWIGCDINKGAIQTTEKRLATVMRAQAARSDGQQRLMNDSESAEPLPAQLSFSVHRVNDYDLQIQHNEAVNLAVQHLGVQRIRTDPFFDGLLGRELVKIVPFDHPLTPLDLQAIEDEIRVRPQEDRDIVVVALGKELAADAWLAEYARRSPVNKMRVIELRTDPKYGGFFEHRPASARVELERLKDGRACVTVRDFMSPSIIERLSGQDGVLTPQIADWRAMVDSLMVDTSYDGQTFDIALADIPERKADLVAGTYDLELPKGSTAVAVRITDMLGEEILEVLPVP